MARPLLFSDGDILSAAERVFAATGYGNTSLRQLLAAAEVSTTAFYSRFESKEAVLIALVERMMAELLARGRDALEGATGVEDGIARGVEALIETLSRHRPVMALALTEGGAIASVRDSLGSAYRALATFLAAHIRGERADAEARAWALVGALQIQVMRWAVFGQLADRDLSPALTRVARSLLEPRRTR
jgi:AcrR family transcriptional regulator